MGKVESHNKEHEITMFIETKESEQPKLVKDFLYIFAL